MAEMRKAMAKMSPSSKTDGRHDGKMVESGHDACRSDAICYTKEMLENEANLNQQKTRNARVQSKKNLPEK